MLYLYSLIIIIPIFIFILQKNKINILKILSFSSFISGLLTIILGYITKIFIIKKVSYINLSHISSSIFNKFLTQGLFMITISLICLIIYELIIYIYRKKGLTIAS